MTRRTKNNLSYYFVLNHAAAPVKPGAGYLDVLAGAQASPAKPAPMPVLIWRPAARQVPPARRRRAWSGPETS